MESDIQEVIVIDDYRENNVITINEDNTDVLIAFDIGIINFSLCVVEITEQKVLWENISIMNGNKKYDAISICTTIDRIFKRFDYLNTTVLLEEQLVRIPSQSIQSNTVALKMIESAIVAYSVAKNWKVFVLYPKEVARKFNFSKMSRYKKKKATVCFIEDLVASTKFKFTENALLNWNSSLKRDDFADSLLLVMHYLGFNSIN